MNEVIKNAMIAGGVSNRKPQNTPPQYGDRKTQYFGRESEQFIAQYARYASDFYDAEAQGLYGENIRAWQKCRIRMADIVNRSASITRNMDDYKAVLVESPRIEYVRPGTLFRAAGSLWLAVNPGNVSSVNGNAIVRRCNAVWNFFDYFGNLHSEPLVIDKLLANASDSDDQASGLVSKGFFNAVCQYNDTTRQLNTNSRMILGSGAYRITGYSDFQTEFTGDYDSVRLLEFTLRYEEPNAAIDDMEHHVAGGKTFSWEIVPHGTPSMRVGETAQIRAESIRCGETIIPTAEHNFGYLFSSSDEAVCRVDSDGTITARAEGDAVITLTLDKNEMIRAHYPVSIVQWESAEHLEFLGGVPERMGAYDSTEITAALFRDGRETDEPITWETVGADKNAYTLTTDGNTATLRCWSGSIEPLTITAKCQGNYLSTEIILEGI